MDLGQFAFAAGTLIGFVNGVKLAADRNWKGFALFSVAVAGGTILGALQWFGLPSAEIGFALGVASSGTYEVAQRIGGK